MENKTIHIKNMCCQRCIEYVESVMRKHKINYTKVTLGKVEVKIISTKELNTIKIELAEKSYEILENKEDKILEDIKNILLQLIIDLQTNINKTEINNKVSLPEIFKYKHKLPYRSLQSIFKKHRHTTIEKYFITLKIEKTKDLIENSHLNFSEIARQLGYSSLAHLSAQFKKITNKTMKEYYNSNSSNRKGFDKL